MTTPLSTTFSERQGEHIVKLLRELMQQMLELHNIVKDLKVMRDALVENIQLDSFSLEQILEVSDSTLYRWRNSPPPSCLPYYTRDNGSIYYNFDEVLKALRKGQLCARGFNRLRAIDNMIAYRDNLLRGGSPDGWAPTP